MRDFLQVCADLLMKLWERMERDGGEDVVFCVIGHVPRQKTDSFVGERGPCIFEHIRDLGTAAMFCEQV